MTWLINGNVLRIPLADESVHCVVSSPPYWGLRKYTGNMAYVWGGNPDCEHSWGEELPSKGKSGWHTFEHKYHSQGSHKTTIGSTMKKPAEESNQGQYCRLCSAWYGELGLEPTPEAYVENMVAVLREVRRVLHPKGTVFLNLGDSYAQSGGKQTPEPLEVLQERAIRKGYDVGAWGAKTKDGQGIAGRAANTAVSGLKPKDLVGIPWRVAFALQQPYLKCSGCDHIAHKTAWGRFPNGRLICPNCIKSKGWIIETPGWWLRSDIIWHKPNPMPESVTDRPTKSHEYVFLLTKRAKYFYDADAVRVGSNDSRVGSVQPAYNDKITDDIGRMNHNTRIGLMREREYHNTRNRRTVWTIPTQSYTGSHFATFPEKLVEPCIKAGTSEYGCCPAKIKKLKIRNDLTPNELEKVMCYLKRKGLV